MLENLVQAYRKEFYDLSLRDWFKIIKKNKRLVLCMMALLISGYIVISNIAGSRSMFWIGITSIFLVGMYTDRMIVKESRRYIVNKHEHLKLVKRFLETIIDGKNLFTEDSVRMLVERLACKVETKNPFYNIGGKLVEFTKTCVIPVITFFCGMYSQKLSELSPMTLLRYFLISVIVCVICVLFMTVLLAFVKNILFRDVDAAVSLREDLLDLQLIYFNHDKKSK